MGTVFRGLHYGGSTLNTKTRKTDFASLTFAILGMADAGRYGRKEIPVRPFRDCFLILWTSMRLAVLLTLFSLTSLTAQLPEGNALGVGMGHLHLKTNDLAANKKFWVETLGATAGKMGPLEIFKIPGVLVVIQKGEASGGTDGSAINHLGFTVKDLDAYIEKCKAGGYAIPRLDKEARQIFVMSPDNVKVELSEDTKMTVPIAHHHIHFYTESVEDTRAWYVKMFGAVPGKRGRFEKADIPGADLSFSKSETRTEGTKGRFMDHIGFEVKGLEAFVKRMESMGVKFNIPYRKVEALGISIAFFTDPWGTYVELTEGLGQF